MAPFAIIALRHGKALQASAWAGTDASRPLTARGVDLRLGTTASQIKRSDAGLDISLANGETVQTDIVLSAVGLRPSTTLAAATGLAVNRGIVVDAYGRSSAPDIYALGDCAEYTGTDGASRTMPYIAPLMNAAPQSVKDALAASVPFPKRLGNAEEYAMLAMCMVENGYFNGEDVRLDGAIRMAPR